MDEYSRWPWLVMADVDAVQSYIFSSVRLVTVAGASEIIARSDEDLKSLAESQEHGGKTLMSAGGAALLLFESDDKARAFAAAARDQFIRKTPGAGITLSEPIHWPDNFSEASQGAAREVEKRKRLGHARPEPFTFPLAQRCQTCGREPAIRSRGVGEDEYLVGYVCDKKWDARDARVSWLEELGNYQESWRGFPSGGMRTGESLASDFSQLAGEDYLGLVVADVNNVGNRLKTLNAPKAYEGFSRQLIDSVKTALYGSIDQVVSEKERASIQNGGKTMPVQVLYQGGDDIVVACRGSLALELARNLTQAFYQSTSQWMPENTLGMSAGVVLAHPKFPFLASHEIAERLLREAKRAALEEGWPDGAVDFAIISESAAEADVLLDDRLLASGDGSADLNFTGRPYRVEGRGVRTLDGFKGACEALGTFPRSRLFDLRRLFSRRDVIARCGQSGSMLSANSIEGMAGRLRTDFAYWQDRVDRRTEDRETWRCVSGPQLGLDTWEDSRPDCFYPRREGQVRWRTCLGDLADGLELWGVRR